MAVCQPVDRQRVLVSILKFLFMFCLCQSILSCHQPFCYKYFPLTLTMLEAGSDTSATHLVRREEASTSSAEAGLTGSWL